MILNGFQRLIFAVLNVVVGILPSLAFFAWIERNSSLPYVGIELGWPWIYMQTWPVAALCAWNFALFMFFGFLHTLFAQTSAQSVLKRFVPPQGVRTIYLVITGLSLFGMMGLWQNTGIVLWALPLGAQIDSTLSLMAFWFFMSGSAWVMNRFDPLLFLGLKQIYMRSDELTRTAGTPELQTQGIFGRVRHPIYTFTCLALVVTPFMTLDRMLVALAMGTYLAMAIPIEEKKLIAIFGQAYEDYRKRVPGVLPKLFP